MKLSEIGEFGFINRIGKDCLVREKSVLKGIGDDAAVFQNTPDNAILVTTDMLVERIHFLKEATTAFDLGYKAMAVNLSDIAAMGGTPSEAFVSIGIPEDCTVAYLDTLYDGMKHIAGEYQVNILGGDTTSSKADLILNITLVGEIHPSEILFRHTAQSNDVIFSTGNLGDSRAGLHIILEKMAPDSAFLKDLLSAHLKPRPHVREGRFLASLGLVHAAIDVSDGLSSDLGHILTSSGVGALLESEKIPLSSNLKRFCKSLGRKPLDYALSGGEDYTLLITVPPDRARAVADAYEASFHSPLFPIGRITSTKIFQIRHASGNIETVSPSGWDHFR